MQWRVEPRSIGLPPKAVTGSRPHPCYVVAVAHTLTPAAIGPETRWCAGRVFCARLSTENREAHDHQD